MTIYFAWISVDVLRCKAFALFFQKLYAWKGLVWNVKIPVPEAKLK
jgi:hypothetical protein